MQHKIWNPSNRKVFCINSITAFAINLFLEFTQRKSVAEVWHFINERTFVFLYNVLILFVILSVVFVAKKKMFAYTAAAGGWFLIGVVNGVVLSNRKTPFTAVDLTLAKSILPILRSYFEMWQIVALILLLIAAVVGLVCLYLYSPVARKTFDAKTNWILVTVFCLCFGAVTYVGVGKGMLIRNFDNLIAGYKDYGVVYGFCVTAFDTGIDRPLNYSRETMESLRKKTEKKYQKVVQKNENETRTPNIIFIQLESFFDLTTVKSLNISEDPIPYFHSLQKEYTSGQLKVPVYGAGTINTEFEVISGMSTDFFGTGEYPYRSILQNHVCDSISYWLKELSYKGSVIHNNNASFYDRDIVFSNLGFDNFITSENMYIFGRNEAGWARDTVLTGQIMDTLSTTKEKDLIYTISVQGHGDYPTGDQSDEPIQVTGEGFSQSELNQFTYYANQIRDMDEFLNNLLEKLADYPEDTMVIAYGDHLPGMNLDKEMLEGGSKYETPYFVWDNFGYNKTNKEKEDENLPAWRLASKVLGQVNIKNGFLNRFHQAMKGTKKYREKLKLVQYDMLYGSEFIMKSEEERKPSSLNFGLKQVKITDVKSVNKSYLLLGEGFTASSRVRVNGIETVSRVLSPGVIKISAGAIKDGAVIEIRQVSETNEKITLNHSEEYVFQESTVTPLYRQEEGGE